MNLHAIVSSAISAVNPFILGNVQVSDGHTTGDDGVRTPKYKPVVQLPMQVQQLSVRDIQHLDGLNISGSSHKVYVQGRVTGLVRVENKGGDIITFPIGAPGSTWPFGTTWYVTAVLEQWPDWCCVAVTLQNGA